MENDVSFRWLGQAGFLLETGAGRFVIDPYLSDSLAVKYAGKKFPHIRMMPPPVAAEKLDNLAAVLCTHGHSDHMDPGTLPALAEASPGCLFICPEAERRKALERGVPGARLVGMDAQDVCRKIPGAGITALPSAHESLETDGAGRSLYLGYIINVCGMRIYHSGDCTPYDGLAEQLRYYGVDAAFLPVNGRDDVRSSNGIAGNFTAAEAAELCRAAGIGTLIPHHFGMFDFNTVSVSEIEDVLSECGLKYIIPEAGISYALTN